MAKVPLEEVRRFMEDCLMAVGAPDSEAKAHAALLLHADVTGHFSHGLNRLVFYINDIEKGATDPNGKPVVLKESAATVLVDGGNALGATVGNFCMDLAIKKAKEAGIGLVTVNHSNHFGMAGWWALKAEQQGLIGLAFTNSSPVLVPTRAKHSACGTNPISMFAPAAGGDSLGVDMATTTVAIGKIEVQVHKNEPIPEGWALGPDGQPTTDGNLALEASRLLPLGGSEQTSGYKGYALSLLVDVLCSGLSGSLASYQVRPWSLNESRQPNLGQCFIAIDPGFFAPGFEDRMSDCLQHLRNMEPVDPSLPVLAPGDKERQNIEQTHGRGTIMYAPNIIQLYEDLAKRLGVRAMQLVA
ncbi:unnamed protein product [Chilo suppressalis]|uniref:Malate dehydrogenase n=1 Tax=Chilo suppressalis TaxID=168631 RepID=A0ABN8L6T0_CHISP|nr:unnamed protein product [Chilo suppressalis]